MRELSHTARNWLRRVRRAWRTFLYAASVGVDEYRIRYELTACLKFKDAARFLPEWIEFHQLVGFEHFYLYNNNSSDDYRGALAPYCRRAALPFMSGRTYRRFRKAMSIVLHIIGTRHAGLHFSMMTNSFFQSMGRIFERF